VLGDATTLLRRAGYSSEPSVLGGLEALVFEDASLLGFVVYLEDVAGMMHSHRELSEAFLMVHAARLRLDPLKAWNIYSVFLTGQQASPEDALELRRLEGDLTGTRKIIRAGVRSLEQLRFAMGPLLPIRNLSLPDSAISRIEGKLNDEEKKFFAAFSDPDRPITDLVEWLITG